MMSEKSEIKHSKNQLDSLILLRGIAIIAVCFCHFSAPLSEGNPLAPLFKTFMIYGKYGVEMFFVVSGFVIPLSLQRGNYSLRNYPLFLYKRLLRLHLPYLVALTITLLLMYVSYKSRHIVFPENIWSIFLSSIYLHVPPDNPVFWTLITEVQYYIFIGLFYILLSKNQILTYLIAFPLLLFFNLTSAGSTIYFIHFIPFFLVGNVVFMCYSKTGNKILNIVVLGAVFLFIAYYSNLPSFIAAFTSGCFILFYKYRVPKLLQLSGNLSYSIYLVHFPIGVKIINLLSRKIAPSLSWLLFLLTFLIVYSISYFLYKYVEEYSEKISKKIKYKVLI